MEVSVCDTSSSVVGISTDSGSGGLGVLEPFEGPLSEMSGESSSSEMCFSSSSLFSSAKKLSSSKWDFSSTDLGDIFGESTGRGLSKDESEG